MGVLGKIAAVVSPIGNAINQSHAASKATKARLKALEDAKAAAGGAYDEIKGYQAPFLPAGPAGVNALTGRLGLPTAPTPALQTYATGGERAPIPADPRAALREGGTLGSVTPGPSGVYAAAPTGGNALTSPGTYGNETNPTAPGAYTPPSAPGGFSFNVEDFVNSPILQAALKRGTAAAEGSAAAQGSLFSGATLKALQDYGLDSSYKFFDNERAFNYGQHRDDVGDYRDARDFGYGASRDNRRDYEDSRNYLTGRFDRGTDDLFRYTGIGERAAGTASNAAQRYGDTITGLVTDAGDAKATNHLTQANIYGDLGAQLAAAVARMGLG